MNATVPGKFVWQPVFFKADDGSEFEILREFPLEMIVKGKIKKSVKSCGFTWKVIWNREEMNSSGKYEATALKLCPSSPKPA
jgi:hypothetical protein